MDLKNAALAVASLLGRLPDAERAAGLLARSGCLLRAWVLRAEHDDPDRQALLAEVRALEAEAGRLLGWAELTEAKP